MPPSFAPSTDWGLIEANVIGRLEVALVPAEVRTVLSAVSEEQADEYPKALPSIFTVAYGTTADDSDTSGNGYLRQDEEWRIDVLIYSASGQASYANRRTIQTLASKVKGAINGYTPPDQVDDNQCLRLREDGQVQDYGAEASAGLKIRQTYVLPVLLQALVT